MMRLPCAYLHGDVELNDERELHIAERHPDLLPDYRDRISSHWPILIRSAEVDVSAAQSCFRDGILISKAANTSSWS